MVPASQSRPGRRSAMAADESSVFPADGTYGKF
jgi:hypothetical protein